MTKTNKKVKSKANANKVVSAKEIKAWLRGIQEFQPEGWVPSPEQWSAICERIYNLDEQEASNTAPHTDYEPYYAQAPAYAPVHVQAQPYAPVSSALTGTAPSAPTQLAVSQSPTESGLVPVSSQNVVLEGDYKSPF